ncbi:alpha/beta fold hydrolase [Nocardia sp. NPDC057668]|uniref:alpha/beta fold hydrolase n=1 Tax=Nocardia sp. NPDC057668 TaxID=3346202 RepID=UPI00367012D6
MNEIAMIEANGLEFGYLSAGPDSGPLALLLHGFPDTPHSWRHVAKELGAAGYRVVAPYMRGYAPTSVAPDGVYRAGALAADANALHEAFGGGADAVLVGHDWGAPAVYGAIAAEPGRWRRAVAMSMPPTAALRAGSLSYEQLKRSFYIYLFQTPVAESVLNADFIAGLWRDWSPGHDEDLRPVFDALRAPENVAAALGYYRSMLNPPARRPGRPAAQPLTASTVPVLYLHGAADGCLSFDAVDPALTNHLPPGSRHALIAEAGHFLQVDQPAAVNAEILDWFTAG